MQRPTIALTVALVVVTGSASAVIWQQYRRIEELSAQSTASESANTQLRHQLATITEAPPKAVPADPAPAPAIVTTTETPNPPDAQSGGARGSFRDRGASRFAEMLANPEIAALMLSQRKASLDSRYAALFKQLGLNPKETEELKNILAERQMARMETGAVARAEGMGRDDRDGMRELIEQSDADSDAQLLGLLGQDRYNTLKSYEQTGTQRSQVNQFATRLSYTATPLQDYQSSAMVQMLAAMPAPAFPSRGATEDETAAYLKDLQAYNDQIYSRSSSILSPDQLAALKEMQQEVTDRAKLATMMRRRGGPP